MLRFSCFVIATVFLSACAIDADPSGPDAPDVSGVWTATLDGTVFQGEDGTGQSTSLRLTLIQSGSDVTGTHGFTDSMGRSGLVTLLGTFIGINLAYASGDFDDSCGGRALANTATVNSTTSGSTMSVSFAAGAGGNCPALSDTLTYTKQ
jgi:hypothetical protein